MRNATKEEFDAAVAATKEEMEAIFLILRPFYYNGQSSCRGSIRYTLAIQYLMKQDLTLDIWDTVSK